MYVFIYASIRKVMNPLSIDYRRDHKCSLEHVMSPEAGSRILSTCCFLAVLTPSKPRFSVISVTLLLFSNELEDLSLDFCPGFGILT